MSGKIIPCYNEIVIAIFHIFILNSALLLCLCREQIKQYHYNVRQCVTPESNKFKGKRQLYISESKAI